MTATESTTPAFVDVDTGLATWQPWTDGYAVGFKVTRHADGAVRYVYLNPSANDGDDLEDTEPCVFLYEEETPVGDGSVCFLTPFAPEAEPNGPTLIDARIFASVLVKIADGTAPDAAYVARHTERARALVAWLARNEPADS